jgi:tRNA threonylcarbamoyladenosine modification (KEOPS) complex  Pcc1 subunit
MFTATITVSGEKAEQLQTLFATEDTEFQNRASYKIIRKKDDVCFEIHALDPTALRAALNAITKTLIIWQKTNNP